MIVRRVVILIEGDNSYLSKSSRAFARSVIIAYFTRIALSILFLHCLNKVSKLYLVRGLLRDK